jgi:excreted virulence factor EspC (type VII ESX diderm)
MTAGDGFAVDTQALRDVSIQLKNITDEVAAHPARDLDAAPAAFGHGRLANATANFSDRLQRAIEALREDTVEVAKRLTATADSYDQCDLGAKCALERVLDQAAFDGGDLDV